MIPNPKSNINIKFNKNRDKQLTPVETDQHSEPTKSKSKSKHSDKQIKKGQHNHQPVNAEVDSLGFPIQQPKPLPDPKHINKSHHKKQPTPDNIDSNGDPLPQSKPKTVSQHKDKQYKEATNKHLQQDKPKNPKVNKNNHNNKNSYNNKYDNLVAKPNSTKLHKIHQQNFDIEIFENLTRRHISDCNKVVKMGKLILVLKDAFVKQAKDNNIVSVRGRLSIPEQDALYKLITRNMHISSHYKTPQFYNITHTNNNWYINLTTRTSAQALDLLAKHNRSQLRGHGSINWFFPGTIAVKTMLNKLKSRNLITGWHLSYKGARIVLDLTNEEFYTVRNTAEVSGLLAMANTSEDVNKITSTKKFVYNRDFLFSRDVEIVKSIDQKNN